MMLPIALLLVSCSLAAAKPNPYYPFGYIMQHDPEISEDELFEMSLMNVLPAFFTIIEEGPELSPSEELALAKKTFKDTMTRLQALQDKLEKDDTHVFKGLNQAIQNLTMIAMSLQRPDLQAALKRETVPEKTLSKIVRKSEAVIEPSTEKPPTTVIAPSVQNPTKAPTVIEFSPYKEIGESQLPHPIEQSETNKYEIKSDDGVKSFFKEQKLWKALNSF